MFARAARKFLPLLPLSARRPTVRFGLGLVAVALATADLRAQAIDYVGNIALPDNHGFILPLNGRNAGLTGTRVMSESRLYRWNALTNALETEVPQFPAAFKISPEIPVAAIGNPVGSSGPLIFAWGARNLVYTYATIGNSFTSVTLSVQRVGSAMFAYANDSIFTLSMSENPDRFYVVNRANGVATDTAVGLVSNVGGTAFGPDGLLYVLDNPNGTYRVQSFDLSDGLADADRLRSSFTVAASLTSGYAGMAINSAGHLFIADGLGGGTAYDLAGNHLDDFTFTGGGNPDTNGRNGWTGASYLNLDDAGNVFVYTPETGLQHYFDTSYSASAVPEPSTYAALIGACALAFVALRRRRPVGRSRGEGCPPSPRPTPCSPASARSALSR